MPKMKPIKIERRVIRECRTWSVTSDSKDDAAYEVTRNEDENGKASWRCNCIWSNIHPDGKPHECDHIEFVKRVGEY